MSVAAGPNLVPNPVSTALAGMSLFKDGRIVDDWTVYDELSLLMQIKLGQMAHR